MPEGRIGAGRGRVGREPRHGTHPEGCRRDVLPPTGFFLTVHGASMDRLGLTTGALVAI